jgi:mRNA interferase RelE/StbE
VTPFAVKVMPEAEADLGRLATSAQRRILGRLDWLGANAEILRHDALQGDEWSGYYRFRVGDYRIIYQLDRSARLLNVLKVGHRRDVYRG